MSETLLHYLSDINNKPPQSSDSAVLNSARV